MPVLQNTYSLQRNGQVTLPMDFRRKYDLDEGDPIVFLEVPEGLLISKKQSLSLKLLDQMREKLEDQGVTLEDLLADSKKIKKQMAQKKYGL
ncbi:MAG: AbrB/MazE/SpoVT family DNA-binding domain-containing protein [Patescibacteria group bacterium]|nr:AbrB/MazE/SpoVT family DNA-binding domain-containing protein [Patescibacteria group bacterium]